MRIMPYKNHSDAVARNRRYYEANRDKILDRMRQYRESCPEKATRWFRTHRKERKDYMRTYRQVHRLDILTQQRNHRSANKDVDVTYRAGHLEEHRLFEEKRRAAKYANTPVDELLTPAEWRTILAEANGHCHYCGKEAKLTLDHVIPLSKGGKHSKDNVVAACRRCNSSKGARTPEEWAGTAVLV